VEDVFKLLNPNIVAKAIILDLRNNDLVNQLDLGQLPNIGVSDASAQIHPP
jgi:hypothetical protein